jgi:hypothetical protein
MRNEAQLNNEVRAEMTDSYHLPDDVKPRVVGFATQTDAGICWGEMTALMLGDEQGVRILAQGQLFGDPIEWQIVRKMRIRGKRFSLLSLAS